MIDRSDEILIQRCIDNELSVAERRQLIDRMDTTGDGWKTLACGFMEDQAFGNAIAGELCEAPLVRRKPDEARSSVRSSHWFHHPMTSVVLVAGIAFVLGVLVPGNFTDSGRPGMNTAQSSAIENGAESGVVYDDGRHKPAVRVQLQPAAGSDLPPFELPMFEDPDGFLDVVRGDRQRLQESWSSMLDDFERLHGHRGRFMQVPVDDEYILLVPVRDRSVE